MADDVELIPISDRDVEEAVFRGWEGGKGPQSLAREFALSITQVEQIIDRSLPVFDAQNQIRAYKRELRRLEDLSGEFFIIAKRDKDRESAHLVARLNERICAMRGFSPVNVRMDPLQVEVAEQPASFERIAATIDRFIEQRSPAERALHERLEQLGPEKALEMLGSPQPNGGPGAVSMLAGSDDKEPSH